MPQCHIILTNNMSLEDSAAATTTTQHHHGRIMTPPPPPIPFYCHILYQTYLPIGYLPTTCHGISTDESSSSSSSSHDHHHPNEWAQAAAAAVARQQQQQQPWSLINTVFVGATTIVNTTILLAVVFLWLVS